jgi:hypothetical protein
MLMSPAVVKALVTADLVISLKATRRAFSSESSSAS